MTPTQRILAIDPGTNQSAWVLYDYVTREILEHSIAPNETVLKEDLPLITAGHIAVEMIACYGMPVGKEVFVTCVWIGRFIQMWDSAWGLVYRKDVKMHLCGNTTAKDGNIRQALIDLFPATGLDGRGVPSAIGTKKHPGPLYGIRKDEWAALGVAVTYAERFKTEEVQDG